MLSQQRMNLLVIFPLQFEANVMVMSSSRNLGDNVFENLFGHL